MDSLGRDINDIKQDFVRVPTNPDPTSRIWAAIGDKTPMLKNFPLNRLLISFFSEIGSTIKEKVKRHYTKIQGAYPRIYNELKRHQENATWDGSNSTTKAKKKPIPGNIHP